MAAWNIAHRGGAGLRPENSLAAFAHAVALGADGAELDAQLSKDGRVVVFHDFRLRPSLCRNASGAWLSQAKPPRIGDLTWEELRRFDIGRPRPGSADAQRSPDFVAIDGERIPLLADVVAVAKTAPKPFRLFVELKSAFAERNLSPSPERLAEAVVAVLADAEFLDHTILVGFDWPGLLHAKSIEPGMACWFTTLAQSWFREAPPPAEDNPPAEPARQIFRHWAASGTSPWAGGFDAVNFGGSILAAIKAAGADGWFAFHRDATDEMVAEAHALGLKVGAWTVNEPDEMERLASLNALCTDRPDILAQFLKR